MWEQMESSKKYSKFKTNTNKTSAKSTPTKVPSPQYWENRFGNVMFTEVSSIELHEWKDQTPTNRHQCIEIHSIRSKSGYEEKLTYYITYSSSKRKLC